MIYTCEVWGQKESQIKKMSELQDKALKNNTLQTNKSSSAGTI